MLRISPSLAILYMTSGNTPQEALPTVTESPEHAKTLSDNVTPGE